MQEKESLVLVHIRRQLDIILSHFNLTSYFIIIHHFFGNNKPDFGRQAFTLYALSKAKEFLTPTILQTVGHAIYALENKIKLDFKIENIVALCYLARAKKNLRLSFEADCEFLEQQNRRSKLLKSQYRSCPAPLNLAGLCRTGRF